MVRSGIRLEICCNVLEVEVQLLVVPAVNFRCHCEVHLQLKLLRNACTSTSVYHACYTETPSGRRSCAGRP